MDLPKNADIEAIHILKITEGSWLAEIIFKVHGDSGVLRDSMYRFGFKTKVEAEHWIDKKVLALLDATDEEPIRFH